MLVELYGDSAEVFTIASSHISKVSSIKLELPVTIIRDKLRFYTLPAFFHSCGCLAGLEQLVSSQFPNTHMSSTTRSIIPTHRS